MKIARQAYLGLAYLFLLGLAVQVYLAGAGIFGDFGDDLDLHRGFGFFVMHLIPLLMLVAAIVGRMKWTFIGLTVLQFLIVFFMIIFLDPEDDDISRWINALHPLMAVVLLGLDFTLAQKARLLVNGESVWKAEPATT
jgi:hypothetical protein